MYACSATLPQFITAGAWTCLLLSLVCRQALLPPTRHPCSYARAQLHIVAHGVDLLARLVQAAGMWQEVLHSKGTIRLDELESFLRKLRNSRSRGVSVGLVR